MDVSMISGRNRIAHWGCEIPWMWCIAYWLAQARQVIIHWPAEEDLQLWFWK